MTFELVRWGWPNLVAVLALALLPLVASMADQKPAAAPARTESAAICPGAAECTTLATAAFTDFIFE